MDELQSIKDNVLQLSEEIKEIQEFDVKAEWITSETEGEKSDYLGQEEFFDKQKELDKKRLYDQECENWWRYAQYQAATNKKTTTLIDQLLLEIGKFELYFKEKYQEDVSKVKDIERSYDNALKSQEELEKELEEWQKKNEELTEELTKEKVREYTG